MGKFFWIASIITISYLLAVIAHVTFYIPPGTKLCIEHGYEKAVETNNPIFGCLKEGQFEPFVMYCETSNEPLALFQGLTFQDPWANGARVCHWINEEETKNE